MFSKDTLQFLEDLKANNNREWFLANKKRYEQYRKDYRLIAEFLAHETLDPALTCWNPKIVRLESTGTYAFLRTSRLIKPTWAFG
jgi:hypothetical protein